MDSWLTGRFKSRHRTAGDLTGKVEKSRVRKLEAIAETNWDLATIKFFGGNACFNITRTLYGTNRERMKMWTRAALRSSGVGLTCFPNRSRPNRAVEKEEQWTDEWGTDE